MKRRILSMGLALIIISSGIPILADGNIDNDIVISKENKIIDLSNLKTYEKNGTIMVPLREVAEDFLDLEVKWINETRSVEIGSGPRWTKITIGENSYFYAKTAPFELSEAPEIKNDLTYVPIEFITEVLGSKINSDDDLIEDMIISGFVKSIKDDNRILVAGDGTNSEIDEILFLINEETSIVDKLGNDFNIENLKVGSKLEVLMPEILTSSLPPQGVATEIKVVDTSVSIVNESYKNNKNINYPQISGLEEVGVNINSNIKTFVEEMVNNELYEDLNLNYEIKFLSNKKISIIFNGKFNFHDSERLIVKSLNFDLKTSKEITFDNYFDNSDESQKKLINILDEAAREQMDIEFEAEGKSIYFKGSNVIVFYYPLDDSVIHPVYLYIPLEDIQKLLR